MANVGMVDIENFESKIRFALMVVSPEKMVSAAKEKHAEGLTTVTLNAWTSGKNRPSRSKLKLVAAILNLELIDFYLDFDSFAEHLCRQNNIPQKNHDIFLNRVKEQLIGGVQLNAFTKYGTAYMERLHKRIRGNYILYNYSISNIPRINVSLVRIAALHPPFIKVTLQSLRDKEYFHYSGTLFAVRSTLKIILETADNHHDEVVVIALNNPADSARKVRFLHGVVLAGSEDYVSHPSAARVLMEKLPESISEIEQALKLLRTIDTGKLPEMYEELISNELTNSQGRYVLRSEHISAADLERLQQVSLVRSIKSNPEL